MFFCLAFIFRFFVFLSSLKISKFFIHLITINFVGVASEEHTNDKTGLAEPESELTHLDKIGAGIEKFLENAFYKLGLCK